MQLTHYALPKHIGQDNNANSSWSRLSSTKAGLRLLHANSFCCHLKRYNIWIRKNELQTLSTILIVWHKWPNNLAQMAKYGAVRTQNQAGTSGQCILGKYRKNRAPPPCEMEDKEHELSQAQWRTKMTKPDLATRGMSKAILTQVSCIKNARWQTLQGFCK